MIRPPAFVFHNGRSARSAHDLLTVLEEGPVDLWSDHVVPTAQPPRNDFATWAEHGLQERSLAQHLRNARTREETIGALRQWLEPGSVRGANVHGLAAKEFFIGVGVGAIIGIVIMNIVLLA
jgi:hypothetical protein